MNIDKQRLINNLIEDIDFITQQNDESNALDAIHRVHGEIGLLLRSDIISTEEASDLYDKFGEARGIAERNINASLA